MTNVILRGEPEAGKMHVRFKNRVSDLASRVVPVLAIVGGLSVAQAQTAVACMTPGFAVESCRITDDARTEAETALPPELPPHAICVVLLKAAK